MGLGGHIVGAHVGVRVGIFEEVVTTDKLGRRTGPRTHYSIEEKRRIVEETRVRGASVATVARRHHVNPNQVFAWRQLYRRGLLTGQAAKGEAQMLPVTVSTPTVLPTERATPPVARATPHTKRLPRFIEIKLRNGHRIVLRGRVDTEALSRVIDLLVQR